MKQINLCMLSWRETISSDFKTVMWLYAPNGIYPNDKTNLNILKQFSGIMLLVVTVKLLLQHCREYVIG